MWDRPKSHQNDERCRKAAFEAQQEKECKRKKMELEQQEVANAEFFSESGTESDDGQNNDPAWAPNTPSTPTTKTRNYCPLPKTGQACDRRGVSSEAAADIINAYSMDMGFLTPQNTHSHP